MTSSPKLKIIATDVRKLPSEAELLLPWYVTGACSPHDARRVAAAVASDCDLADDLAAARAERAKVVAMGEALGRPSRRPLLALFAAIDAGAESVVGNVTRLTFARPAARFGFEADAAVDPTPKKFSRRR